MGYRRPRPNSADLPALAETGYADFSARRPEHRYLMTSRKRPFLIFRCRVRLHLESEWATASGAMRIYAASCANGRIPAIEEGLDKAAATPLEFDARERGGSDNPEDVGRGRRRRCSRRDFDASPPLAQSRSGPFSRGRPRITGNAASPVR